MENQTQQHNIIVGGQKKPSGLWANKKLVVSVFVFVFAAIGGIMLIRTFAAPSTTVVGLLATYYNNADFTGASISRVDPNINFN
jgi:hypothetical protein